MSGNSSKKKQEEKNLKTLREFLALPGNKTCFDCNQRGPTYVNTTIGTFVCISCSGKLRGLTPPHRVKSVTMASFTQEEIDLLRKRGNEYCRLVWMSHYNMADLANETKDEQKFKDHLVAKYEKKRWYADPGTIPADRLPAMPPLSNGSEAASHHHQDHQHAPSAVTTTTTHSPVARPAASGVPVVPFTGASSQKSSDLLADLDFFTGAPAASSSSGQAVAPVAGFPSPRGKGFGNPSGGGGLPQSISQPSFANFSNADFFFPPPGISPQKAGSGSVGDVVGAFHHGAPAVAPVAVNGFGTVSSPKEAVKAATHFVPQPEDKYSALKDLDALFTTATAAPSGAVAGSVVDPVVASASSSSAGAPSSSSSASAWTPAWTASPQKDASILFGSSPGFAQPNSSNPFLVASPAPATAAVSGGGFGRPALPWANFSTPSNPVNGAGGGLFPAAVNGHYHPSPMTTGLTSSQSLDLSPKTWSTAPTSTMNPFVDAASTFGQGRSHNPFL